MPSNRKHRQTLCDRSRQHSGKERSRGTTRSPGAAQQSAPTRAAAKTVIVGVGVSAGGLEALQDLFRAMPVDTGLAFVLIQHLDPTHPSLTAELLAKATPLPVVQAGDRMHTKPNHVYAIPPNRTLTVRGGVLRLDPPLERNGVRLPIDTFFRALAESQAERAIGIVLSGTGTDGTQGLKAIKAQGGMAIAQEPVQAEFRGMPQSAIDSGLVDYVLPVEQMPAQLLRFAKHPYVLGTAPVALREGRRGPDHLGRILALFRARTQYDFRTYKTPMLTRRIERRMGLRQIEHLSGYHELLRDNAEEAQALVKDLLISVTRFFRDAEAFKLLGEKVVPPLIESHAADAPLRVWVPGCADGEEAYSLAMVLRERLATAQKHGPLQVFATDIDRHALDLARAGIYPASIAHDVSPARLQRFFVQHGEHFQVCKPLRDSVLFAVQNLISDAPFSKLDLISCRNLLIYLEPEMQKKLISLFRYALNPDGILFLGPAETIGQQSHQFESISHKWRIFRRIGSDHRISAGFPFLAGEQRPDTRPVRATPPPASSLGELTRELLLARHTPAAVVINRQHEILYYHGPTSRYLDQPTGAPTHHLLSLVRDELRTALRGALHKALRDKRRSAATIGAASGADESRQVTITVTPLVTPAEVAGLFLVTFSSAPATKGAAPSLSRSDATVLQQLEQELKTTRADLHSTIDQLELANEELKASNEKVMSMNEEFQSTNEELETSKEELQTLNEELLTVNRQLEAKIGELEGTNNDLANFLTSTDIATVFLDTELRIKRFTPATTRVLHLIPTDIGRPVQDIASKLRDDDFLSDARTVVARLSPVEKETRADDGGWFLRRILPYRTRDNKIEGVVVTFSDVTQLKRAEQIVQAARAHSESILETVHEALVVLNSDLRVVSVNRSFCELFHLAPAQVRGRSIFDVGDRPCDNPQLRALLEEILPKHTTVAQFELPWDLPSGGRRIMLVNARQMRRSDGMPETILLALEDVTERRAAEGQQRTTERLAALGTFAAGVAHDINNPLTSMLLTARMALRSHHDARLVKQSLEEMIADMQRCARVVKSVLGFAKPETPVKRPVNINAVVRYGAAQMRKYAQRSGVRIRFALATRLPSVEADRAELEQALINVVNNAIEASRSGQTIVVRTVAQASCVRICIHDKGRGMTPAQRERVFDPYFTTREREGGNGLGLSLAHGIIRRHGGTISLESEPEQGTTVVIEFPLPAGLARKPPKTGGTAQRPTRH